MEDIESAVRSARNISRSPEENRSWSTEVCYVQDSQLTYLTKL